MVVRDEGENYSITPEVIPLGTGSAYAETTDFVSWDQTYSTPRIENGDNKGKRADIIVDQEVIPEKVNQWEIGKIRDEPSTYLMNFQEFGGPSRSYTGYLTIGENNGDITVIGDQDSLNSPYNTEVRIHLMPENFGKTSFQDVEEALSNHDRRSNIKNVGLN